MKKRPTTLAPWQVIRIFHALHELEVYGKSLEERVNPISKAHGFYIKAFIKELEQKAGIE